MDQPGNGSVVVWVWCGYYCLCAEVRRDGPGEPRTEVLYPRLPHPRLPRLRRRAGSRRRAQQWTEDQLPWSEPPTFPLARG